MYSRSAKGGGKGDPNRNPWLAKMVFAVHACYKSCNAIFRNYILHFKNIQVILYEKKNEKGHLSLINN